MERKYRKTSFSPLQIKIPLRKSGKYVYKEKGSSGETR